MRRRATREAAEGDRDDTVLVAAACAGDHLSFAALFRRHAPDLLRFVERRSGSAAVADDVVAVTFEKAWTQVCELDARGIPFRPWVFRLAGNALIDQRRGADRRQRREAAVSTGDHRLAEAAADPGEPTRDHELRAAISRLSTAHQEIVSLRWFADLTPKEVAVALGVTPGTAAVRSHRALTALRRALSDEAEDARAATTTTHDNDAIDNDHIEIDDIDRARSRRMNDDRHSDDRDAGGDEVADGLIARLERLGDQHVEVADERLDAIEARVRASVDQRESGEYRSAVALVAPGTSSVEVRNSSPWSRIVLVAASIAVLVALSVAALGTRDDTLVVAAADDVTVLLPDGDSIMAADGTELPDDSVLEVTGFVDVGGRRYGPGRYRVDDGRLVPIVDDSSQVVSTDGDTTEDTTPTGTAADQRDAPETERPTSPDTPVRPTVSSTTTAATPTTRPAAPQPPVTRPAATPPPRATPPRTTAPDRTVPQRPPTPTTTSPAVTSPPTSGPVRTSTTAATTTSSPTSTTTTTVVRGRPAVAEPVRAP